MVRSRVRDAVAHRDRELKERAARDVASRLREEGQREAIQEREDIIKQLELQRRVTEESTRQREEERIIREQVERNAEVERERARAEEAEEEALRADVVRREIAKVDAAREEVSRRESAYRAAVQAEMSRAVASRGGEPVPVALSMWTKAEREWGPRAGVMMGSTTIVTPCPPRSLLFPRVLPLPTPLPHPQGRLPAWGRGGRFPAVTRRKRGLRRGTVGPAP